MQAVDQVEGGEDPAVAVNVRSEVGRQSDVRDVQETRLVGGHQGLPGRPPAVREVEGQEEVEIGWHVHRAQWNRGFATEAATACRDHCFDALGLERVISLIRPENVPSRRVAEKIGMSIEREVGWHGYRHFVYAASTDR